MSSSPHRSANSEGQQQQQRPSRQSDVGPERPADIDTKSRRRRQTTDGSTPRKPLPATPTSNNNNSNSSNNSSSSSSGERNRLMELFGTYQSSSPNSQKTSSEGSSSQHRVKFPSPTPPTSAELSSSSGESLPHAINLSMPLINKSAEGSAKEDNRSTKSANRSPAGLSASAKLVPSQQMPQERTPLNDAGRQQAKGRLPDVSGLSDKQKEKIVSAYNNQFAHLLGLVPSKSSSTSPAVSLISGSSFNSPRTITLEDLQKASRMKPRQQVPPPPPPPQQQQQQQQVQLHMLNNEQAEKSAKSPLASGKWSQPSTPSPRKDRDSGLFGGHFNLANSGDISSNRNSGISGAGGFEPILELDEENGSWSQSVARRSGVTPLVIDPRPAMPDFHQQSDTGDEGDNDETELIKTPNRRPKYDVHVPPPESLARTPSLLARSPTPTDGMRSRTPTGERPSSAASRSRSPSLLSSGRRRATTMATDTVSSTRTDHSRSRSFGTSTRITLQQLQRASNDTPLPGSNSSGSSGRGRSKSTTEDKQPLLRPSDAFDVDDLSVPLIPPPPEGGLQFFNPFVGGTTRTGSPQYLYQKATDAESVTRTRIRHRKQRQASSVNSAASPVYTLNSAYSPSNAGSSMTHELAFLGIHKTMDSPYQQGILSRLGGASHVSSHGLGSSNKENVIIVGGRDENNELSSSSASSASNGKGKAPYRPHHHHKRSESTGSRVSSIREEFEQLERGRGKTAEDLLSGSPRPSSALAQHHSDLSGNNSPGTPTTPRKHTPVLERWETKRKEVTSSGASKKPSSSRRKGSGQTTPVTPHKVAEIRERIEEWQRNEIIDSTGASRSSSRADAISSGGASDVNSGRARDNRRFTGDSALTGDYLSNSSATATHKSPPAVGDQQQIVGEIELVTGSSSGGASSPPANARQPASGSSSEGQLGRVAQVSLEHADDENSSASPYSPSRSQPRLVPLTPQPQRADALAAKLAAAKNKALLGEIGTEKPATATAATTGQMGVQRSNTQASRESQYSSGTAQSSNVPPSLYGSDKSVFDTPLLSGLPQVSVPSDIPSLRTMDTMLSSNSPLALANIPPPAEAATPSPPAAASPKSTKSKKDRKVKRKSHDKGKEPESAASLGDRESKILGTVLGAVSSPVSIGGHKKQSLVVDSKTVSAEVRKSLQQIKANSPEMRTSPSPSLRASRISSTDSISIENANPSLLKSSKELLESPQADLPSATTLEDRRKWAQQRPDSRLPLGSTEMGQPGKSSAESGDKSDSMRIWDEKLRRRAEKSKPELPIRPMVADSPALATQPKDSGGLAVNALVEMPQDKAARRDSKVSTPSADGKHRDEMISQTLATLEGAHVAAASAAVTAPSSASGSHRSKGHRKNRQNRDRQQQSSSQSSPASTPKSGSGKTSQAAVTFPDNPQPNARLSTIEEVETKSSSNVDGARRQANPAQGSSPGSVISDIPDSVNPSSGGKPSPPGKASPPYSIGSRPKSQNMGRHGSSPLNPYHTGDISSYVGPGISQIPEQPAGKQPGLIQKITGTIRRRRADAPPAADEPDRAGAQTPLPRRWWRNIRESIIHPQPQPQPEPEPQVPADAAPNADPTSPLVTDQLSGRPSRRHSFNGSTMLEQEKITAALSPRENLRRKLTVIDRFRGAIRGWRGQSLAAAATAATTGAASGTSAAVGANTGSVKSGVGEFKVAGSPGNHKLALAHTPAPSPIPHKPVLNPLNPFYGLVDQQQQQQTAEAIEDSGAVSPGNKGPKRRASIDVLSVHEMAEVDHAELQNRLQNLVSPGVSEALSGPAPIWDENRPGVLSLSHSPDFGRPHNGSYAPSSKFSFHAPSPPPPPAATAGSGAKPLPPTPHGSKPSGGRQQIPSTLFTFPAGHSRSETAQSSVFHLSGTHIQQVPPAAQPDANKATSAVSSGSGQKGRPLPQPPTGHVAEPAVDVLQSQSVITGIQSQVQQAPAANVPPPSVLKPQTEKVQFVNQDGSIQVQTAQVAQTPVPPSADDVKPRKKSFFKRLTAGWRNPSPVLQDVELQPQQQQQHSGTYQGSLAPTQQQQQQGPLSGSTQVPPMQPHHSSMQSNIAQGAVQGIAGAVATTATSNMAGKIMGAVSSQSNAAGSLPKTEAVPDVNVVSSASQSQQVHTPVLQQQQQQGMGSMVPPTAVGSGSGPQMLQQPLDHSQMSQQPPVQPYATMSTNPNSYSEYNPNFDSLQQSYVLQQNQQQQQQQQQQVAGAGPGGQIPGNSPPTAHTSPQSETPVGTPESGHLPEEPKTSKLMSVVQGIPLIGPLFGKKKKQEPKPKTEAPRPSSVNSAITHQTQHHSQYHSQASSVYIGQPEPEESTNPYMKMIEAAGDKIHFIFPAFVYFTRRMAIGEIMPLVGRYAVRYPLVEAEEQAVANAVARIEQDVVKSGAERALRAPEFKFAAPALRYNSLDQRLENAMVPRFSKPRKFRRAPEVWDDPEAQQIADRVYGRLRDFRRDLHQEQTRVARALSRGGADNASRPGARAPGSPTDPLPNMRDVENGIRSRGVDGHQGSGDRVLVGGGGGRDEGGIAGRIGGFFGGLMGKSKDEPVPPQPSASYHTRSRGNSLRFDSRLSPRAQGFSLSTDMDKQHSLDGSLPRSNGESEARHSRDIADENLADGGERRGIYQRLFGGWMKPKSEEEEEDDGPIPVKPMPDDAAEGPATAADISDKKPSSKLPPMFPPFSHLPPRAVDSIMHRVSEPRVFIGSAKQQLVSPANNSDPRNSILGDSNPYSTGTEWNFYESHRFSSPYPTTRSEVNEKRVWEKNGKKLGIKSDGNDIARWTSHLEIIRDFIQLIGLILGTIGFTKAPLNTTVGDEWPWIVVSGIPKAIGLQWADLSTTTGKSIGFVVFFCLLSLGVLGMWAYGTYLERPMPRSTDAGTAGDSTDRGHIMYQDEVSSAPSPLNIYGRIFGQMPKRRRMHILYAILTTLYLPVVKICMDAIVWNQGFWPVSNPFRTTDKPIFPRPQDGFRDPGRFCYTTTMKNGRFNGAYLILPLAIATLLGLGFWLPLQLHQLSKVHMPRVYGWDHGKGPGNSVPNEEQDKKSQQAAPMPPVTVGDDDDEDGNDEHRQLRSLNGSQQQRGALAATRAGPGSDVIARDDPNPLLEGLSGLAGGFAGVNPETIGYLGTLLNFANGNGLGDSQQQWGMLEGLFGKFTSMLKNNNEEDDPDLYAGLEKEEAYQKRLSRMKEKHRNRHLATVKYRRALDTDTSDFRFIYAPNYPGHASCGARELLWKFAAVFVAVVLDKDNCWSKQHSRHSLDAGRNAVLLIIALLMLRSHHSHRPFFDPTANLSALFSRIGIVVVVIFAFPLFLMHDPLSSSHTGAAMTLALINFCLLLLMLWLASSSLPKIQVALKGPSASLTLSPGILVATSPYDPRLRRLLIERVWQDTWSAILLASRDFRLLPNHRVAFCKTRAHPPYMVNYIGFAAERHLENMYLYDQIGRQAYCRAVELERNNRQRFDMTIEILRFYIGPDMYFNPYATGEAPGRVQSRFGVGLNDVKSWFGKVYVLHFPFMVCMIYDDLPNVIVPIAEEHDLFTYLQQNNDEATRRKREVRRGLRSLNGQYVTLTYIEGGGSNGSHLRYNVNPNTEDHEHFLRRYAGYRRILYRGKVHIKHHSEQMWNGLFNVNPGFGCSLEITDEMVVDDESLVNDFSREQNPFRMAFWRTGRAGSAYRTNVTQRSKANLRMNATNAHLLGVTHDFDYNPDINALFAENIDIIDARRTAITDAIELYQREYRKEFERKRTGLSPAFHIDVFAPGPESFHAVAPSNGQPPPIPVTPALFEGRDGRSLNGQWNNDPHGRLSFIPTMEQLTERLELDEANKYVKDILVDHRDDIAFLYERLRTLVPSESNDPVKFAWYVFWDDIYRRYAREVKQLKEYESDFNPLYPQSLPYYPLPRHKLERFLYERGLWKPLNGGKGSGGGGGGGGGGLFSRWFGGDSSNKKSGSGDAAGIEEFNMDPMPVPDYVPGMIDTSPGHGGMHLGGDGGAHVWRVGDDMDDRDGARLFPAGSTASGFIHSGLLNRLYAWLDVIAYGVNR